MTGNHGRQGPLCPSLSLCCAVSATVFMYSTTSTTTVEVVQQEYGAADRACIVLPSLATVLQVFDMTRDNVQDDWFDMHYLLNGQPSLCSIASFHEVIP